MKMDSVTILNSLNMKLALDPKHAKILVVGLGLTGISVAHYLQKLGFKFAITDSRAKPPLLDDFLKTMPDAPVFTGGFDEDLKCRDYQFALGETFAHKGTLSLCNSGFHVVENPLDVLNYYGVAQGNRYAEVDAEGVSDQKELDTKRVCSTLKIGAELSLKSLIEFGVKFTLEKAKSTPTSGNSANSATSGYSAHSATSGDYAHSATSGYSAHSATSGNSAHSATSGDYANSATSGDYANSATSGDYANSSALGKNAIAVAIGMNSAAKAVLGNWIVLSEYKENGIVKAVKTAKVDGKKIQADTFYTLKKGKFVKAKL